MSLYFMTLGDYQRIFVGSFQFALVFQLEHEFHKKITVVSESLANNTDVHIPPLA